MYAATAAATGGLQRLYMRTGFLPLPVAICEMPARVRKAMPVLATTLTRRKKNKKGGTWGET